MNWTYYQSFMEQIFYQNFSDKKIIEEYIDFSFYKNIQKKSDGLMLESFFGKSTHFWD